MELLQALQAATDFQLGALCPQVIDITWPPGGYAKESFQYLSLFLGPRTLRLFLLSVNPNRYAEVTFLRYILKHLPFLKELIICRHVSAEDFDRILDPCVYLADTSLKCLESLTLNVLSDDAIRHLLSLPCLATLKLNLGLARNTTVISSPRVRRRSGFESLRFLDLTASWNNVVSLLQHLPCESPIESLRADYRSDDADAFLDHVERFQKIIDVVASHANPETLRTFHAIEYFSSSGRREEPLDLGSAAIPIDPLFVFKELRNLSLRCFRNVIWLTPEEVKMIPIVWPNIEELSLLSSCAYRIPRIDHTHLLELTYNCRHLQTLEFTFDATKITGEERHLARPGLAAARIDTLSVDHSPIESPSQVATFLALHYPDLKRLWYEQSSPDPYAKRWWAVKVARGI
jgi:hypothetical protein